MQRVAAHVGQGVHDAFLASHIAAPSVNATFLTSKVKSLYNGADIIWYDPTGDDDRAQYIYREGESTLAFYGYEWAGVDPSNGASVYYVNAPEDDQTGDFIYNGRGATYDYKKANNTIIGNAIPAVTGGLNTTLSYKGIELAANFIYKIGGSLYDGAYKDVADDGYYVSPAGVVSKVPQDGVNIVVKTHPYAGHHPVCAVAGLAVWHGG